MLGEDAALQYVLTPNISSVCILFAKYREGGISNNICKYLLVWRKHGTRDV